MALSDAENLFSRRRLPNEMPRRDEVRLSKIVCRASRLPGLMTTGLIFGHRSLPMICDGQLSLAAGYGRIGLTRLDRRQ